MGILSSCSVISSEKGADSLSVTYYPKQETGGKIALHSPVFIVDNKEKEYNRIGQVEYEQEEGVVVNVSTPVMYVQERDWESVSGRKYTNLIYRVHFPETPFSVFPFYLTAGENVGLFVIVTLDHASRPVLYTTLHTCGCYLAFIPTSNLSPSNLPVGWEYGKQDVYGERLPAFFELKEQNGKVEKIHLRIGDAEHRVRDAWMGEGMERSNDSIQKMSLAPLQSLKFLQKQDGSYTSMYENSGDRMGYVKDSQKIFEKLLMGWWAFDLKVGEDKYLGEDKYDGPVFYTSLKPWAREESDLRDFAGFMDYWGWKL